MEFLAYTRSIEMASMTSLLPLSIIGGIALGVVGKYFYDFAVMYLKAKDKDTVKWDMKGFFITVVLSAFIGFLLYGFIFERSANWRTFG